MVKTPSEIDIKESYLRGTGRLLEILLKDQTTNRNIIWATDSYKQKGPGFGFADNIEIKYVTGAYHKLIQPRASKSFTEQRQRTKEKAEVFTPRWIVKKINEAIDNERVIDQTNWQDYVRGLRLEITCGEAPFIATRYNPTSTTGKLLKLKYRVGFLDKKLRVISKYCNTEKDWLKWAKKAYQSSYGYEWQGDNILIARENLLYTFIDYYKKKFKTRPALEVLEEFAKIISWNIFQMDGLKYIIPMSCSDKEKSENLSIFCNSQNRVLKSGCDGCNKNNYMTHNGIYVKIMDWEKKKQIRFVDLLTQQNNP